MAETTFELDGVRFSYRMAATSELLEDFTDISGMAGPFERISAGEVAWCRAKINYTPGGPAARAGSSGSTWSPASSTA